MRVLAVCAAVTGLLTIVLWPSKSFAAIIPACENDFVTNIAPPAPPPADGSCESAAGDDDIDNSRVAPICDTRAASGIAPPRLRGVSDLGFDIGRDCDSGETVRAAVRPGRGESPTQPPDTTMDRAVLPALELIAPTTEATLIDPLAPTGGPRAGVHDDVYHPPR